MSNELDDLLYRAAEDSLASLAFMLLVEQQPTEAPASDADGGTWAAETVFAGPLNGKVLLVTDDSLLGALARHVLCLPRAGDRKAEALRHLVRVVCGHLLLELAVGDSLPQVQPPRLLGRDEAIDTLSDRRPAAGARLDLADGTVELALFIDRYSANGRTAPSMAAARH